MNVDVRFFPFVLVPYLPIGINAKIATDSINWFKSLSKPTLTPPAWLFGPIWAIFYALMGAASFLVWRDSATYFEAFPLAVYGVHLLFNWAWTPVFFGAKRLVVSNIVSVSLLVVSVLTFVVFLRVNQIAAFLLIPYAIWLIYLVVINILIAVNNEDQAMKAVDI